MYVSESIGFDWKDDTERMKIDTNPLFRKVTAPWYDSNTTCWIALVALLIIAVFSGTGISVARSRPDYHHHIWVPVTLLVLSLIACGSVAYRLIKRHYDHQLQDRDY